jgi:two-component system, chemotaxis family, sensor kinase Cph1
LSVPHAVRVSGTVLAQVLSITVERNELSQRALAEHRIEGLRGQVANALASADDATAGLLAANDAMRGLIGCDALSVLVGQRVGSFPENLDRAAAIKVADYLSDHRQDLLVTDSVSRDVPALDGLLTEANHASGILAIQLSGTPAITIIWWRAELIETVHWAGQPEKITATGTSTERLRPRKSFELWKETVRGSSRAWDAPVCSSRTESDLAGGGAQSYPGGRARTSRFTGHHGPRLARPASGHRYGCDVDGTRACFRG